MQQPTLWHPDSWQAKPCVQAVEYADPGASHAALTQLRQLPPLVTVFEVERLKQLLAAAGLGQQFVLQGGDCAEMFADCAPKALTNKLRILLQMSVILIHGLQKPIVRVGRIAGQYAKPRSSAVETQAGVTLPTYRGDLINQPEFSSEARQPDPWRMLYGYCYSGLSLNYLRALATSGFADLQHPEYWNLDFAKHSPMAGAYQTIAESISATLQFIKVAGGQTSEQLQKVDLYTSHEALHLPYESALTRQHESGQWYNLSTHFPWVGMRTAQLNGAHIEYLRGISNPVAVKIGSDATADFIQRLAERLNPENEPGRLTFITRFGARAIGTLLPPLLKAAHSAGLAATWFCDPLHGNTTTTKNGYKTRSFDDILSELSQALQIHNAEGKHLGGVHFELTGDNVTECIGGTSGITEADLQQAYQSLVDPRLNYEQALEMAMLIAHTSKAGRAAGKRATF